MAVTGKLGISDSLLGNLLLGDMVVDTLTTTDSPTLSESVSRTASVHYTTTDAPTTSESATRILSALRAATDTPTLADIATAVIVFGTVTFDSPTLSGSAVVIVTAPRTTTDAPTVSESIVSIVTAPRTTTDAPTLSESIVRVGVFSRTTSEAPTLSESIDWVGTFSRTTTDAPTISEDASASKTFIKTTVDAPTLSEVITSLRVGASNITDAPTLSESATVDKILFKSISQSLTITQSNLVATPIQSVEQGLVLTQTVVHSGEYSKSASNSLNPIQAADYFQFKPTDASNTLTITQTADFVQTTGVGNTLTITQDVAYQYDPHLDQQFAVLVPTQTVTVVAIFDRVITQPVTLVQTVIPLKIITQAVTSTLGIYQTAVGGPLRNASNTLDLDQAVVSEAIRNPVVATQSLHATQSVGLQMILNRGLVSTLVFKNEHPIANGAGGFIEVPNLILTKGGSGSVECCPVSRVSTVFQSSSRAIVLPNPELNDGEGLVAAVSIKRTITGMTYSYVKKSANRKLKYKFLINQRKAYELRQFLLDFLGERISHTNWKGEMWSGYLLTDPAEITSNARGGVCTGDLYEIDLEYQGVRVN